MNDLVAFFLTIFFQTEKRNPDAFPPKRAFGKFLLKVAPFFQFLKSDNGIFALRMGLVSVALWVPSVCHSSAWFYYNHKGLWALIMAQVGLFLFSLTFSTLLTFSIQTALAVYAGDQVGIPSPFFEEATTDSL